MTCVCVTVCDVSIRHTVPVHKIVAGMHTLAAQYSGACSQDQTLSVCVCVCVCLSVSM